MKNPSFSTKYGILHKKRRIIKKKISLKPQVVSLSEINMEEMAKLIMGGQLIPAIYDESAKEITTIEI